MTQDEIIQEVRANREAYAREFNFDIRALYRDAKENELRENRNVVSLTPRHVRSRKTAVR